MHRAALLVGGLTLLGLAALTTALQAQTSDTVPESARLSEAARWLQGYLRVDTSNPPGGEHRAAAYLASILHRAGITTRTYVSPEGRSSLYARLPATESQGAGEAGGTRGALVLLHHMDVVPPGPGWTVEPFAGAVSAGRLWGRGAVDAKSLGIAQLAAMIALQRGESRRVRDVVFLAVADEESGGTQGAGWLLEHHPELFGDTAAVLNEGGANLVLRGELQWWGVEVAQKRPLWIEAVASGREGHGAGVQRWNATHHLIRALDRLLAMELPWRVTPPVREYLAALAPLHQGRMREVFSDPDAFIRPEGPTVALLPGLELLFLDSVQVTGLEGSHRINVLPAKSRAEVDIRLLPDTDADAFLARVREALGNRVEVHTLLSAPPSPPSPTTHPVYRLLQELLGEEGPVVPAFIGGFTDSRFFRQRGIPAYGIAPFAAGGEDLSGIHGTDERLSLAELDRGVERLRRIVTAWALGETNGQAQGEAQGEARGDTR